MTATHRLNDEFDIKKTHTHNSYLPSKSIPISRTTNNISIVFMRYENNKRNL